MQGNDQQALLDSLYNMEPGPQGFRSFLLRLGEAMNSHAVALQSYDPSHRLCSFRDATGVSGDWLARFEASKVDNLWFKLGAPQLVAEGVVSTEGLLRDDILERSDFYRDWLQPVDIRHSLGCCLRVGDAGQVTVITINRDDRRGAFTKEELGVGRFLLPHLRNAYALHQRLSWMENLAGGFRAALDHIAPGVYLIDRQGAVIFKNQVAERQTPSQTGIACKRNRIAATSPQHADILKGLLERAVAGEVVNGPETLLLRNASGEPAATVCVIPIAQAASSAWNEPRVTAIVFVREMTTAQRESSSQLQRIFGLTHAEELLATHLCQGHTLSAAAKKLSRSRETLRSQLRALFAKTGTHRQADLLYVLMTIAGQM